MNRMTVAAVIAAGALALTACGGSGSDAEGEAAPQEGGAAEQSAAAEPAEEEAPAEAEAPTAEELSAAIQAAGFEIEEVPEGDAASAMLAEGTIDPPECEAFVNAAVAAQQNGVVDQVVGAKKDGQLMIVVSAASFPDSDTASGFVGDVEEQAKPCAEMTMDAQGTEITMSLDAAETEIDGADAAVSSTASGDAAGYAMEMTTVYGAKGPVVVSGLAVDLAGGQPATEDDIKPDVAAIIAELP